MHLTIRIIVVLVLFFFIWLCNPKVACQRKLHFTLPDSAKMEKHSYVFLDNRFYAKISFDSTDYDKIKRGLNNNFRKLNMAKDIIITNFSDEATWWDMEGNEIEMAYRAYKSGIQIKSIPLYAFITQNTQGQYFLYLVI